MRAPECTESPTRAAVVNLLRAEREWRRFFRNAAETGTARLWAQAHQFRDELQARGEWHDLEEVGVVLLTLAREKLPESAAARWSPEWASRLCKDSLARMGEHYAGLSGRERDVLDFSGQDAPEEAMLAAGEENDPAAFRAALKEWERAGLEALEDARKKRAAS